MQSFARDLAIIRRRGLLGSAALLATTLSSGASAATPDVVLCNCGGDAIPAFDAAFVKPYAATTGGRLVLEGSGASNGKVRAMVEARSVA